MTVSVRQRRAAALTSARIMIDDMVGHRGPLQGGSLVARLAATGPVDLPRWLRVRFSRSPLFFFRPSLAGGLELVVLSRAAAALEFGDPLAQRAFSRSSASFSLTRAAAQAQQTSGPIPEWL